MFDIGFWELVVVGIVVLLVLGPERLPTVARTVGLWYGKARYFIGSVKADIDRELKAEELKRIIQEQGKSEGLFDMVEEAKASLQDIKSNLDDVGQSLEDTRQETETAAAKLIEDAKDTNSGKAIL
ncbi:MAG: Sec-independent protein translocase protein TatB [Thiohalomonadaceae bacterium]